MGLFSFLSSNKLYKTVNQFQAEEIATNNKNLKLLDVRTPEEFRQGSLKGAIHININESTFLKKAETIDKNSPLIVYCRSGVRSAKACKILTENGFKAVYNLKGGIMSWKGDYKIK